MNNWIVYIIRKIYRKIHRYFLRRRLQNRDFTILAPTCIAGIIYHELGLQFASPTINLWMYDKDFLKFVHNLQHYLDASLRFVEGIDSTPAAYLDDILIHFNHYHSEEEARTKWEERKKRIHLDNLYIIMADQPDGGVSNRMVFTIRDFPDLDYTMHLPKDPDKECVNMYMFDKSPILGRFRWEREWDYVKWLNNGVKELMS